jgi:hypothetical protein
VEGSHSSVSGGLFMMAEWMLDLLCFWDDPRSYQRLTKLFEVYIIYLALLAEGFQLGHTHFIPRPFQFIIHEPGHTLFHILSNVLGSNHSVIPHRVMTTSLIKPQINFPV